MISKRRKGLHGPIEVNNGENQDDDFDDELPDDQNNEDDE